MTVENRGRNMSVLFMQPDTLVVQSLGNTFRQSFTPDFLGCVSSFGIPSCVSRNLELTELIEVVVSGRLAPRGPESKVRSLRHPVCGHE